MEGSELLVFQCVPCKVRKNVDGSSKVKLNKLYGGKLPSEILIRFKTNFYVSIGY